MAIDSVKNLFAIAELRKRVLFTLGMLVVYRIGGHIPTPGMNTQALAQLVEQARGTMFGLYDMFSGDNLSRMTIFALGIMPYISASIILQLLTVVWPYLERISKEGELGRRKITQYTRYGTILLERGAVVRHRDLARALDADRRRLAAGVPARLGLPSDDGAHADDGDDAHHVAWRADHRARHRQRHVVDHLRRHRRRLAERGHHDVRSAAHGSDGADSARAARRGDGVRHRRHHLRRARQPAHYRPVREARGRARACMAARARTSR